MPIILACIVTFVRIHWRKVAELAWKWGKNKLPRVFVISAIAELTEKNGPARRPTSFGKHTLPQNVLNEKNSSAIDLSRIFIAFSRKQSFSFWFANCQRL